jgi:hypothetical protein
MGEVSTGEGVAGGFVEDGHGPLLDIESVYLLLSPG